MEKYVDNIFSTQYQPTIGVDFRAQIVEMPIIKKKSSFNIAKIHDKSNNKTAVDDNLLSEVVKLQLWDTAGQERFKFIVNSYYRNAHCIIFVFDLTDIQTLLNIKQWYRDMQNSTLNESVELILLGNKKDLEKQISDDDINLVMNELNIKQYFEVSAKKDTVNINNIMNNLAIKLKQSQEPIENNKKTLNLGHEKNQQKYCCFM